MLDPEDEDSDGDGGEQVGDLTTIRGGLICCCCGECGELGVGVAWEGGVGRVDICWPAGRVVVVTAGCGGGRERVCLLVVVVVVGWRRLRRFGGGGGGGEGEVTSRAVVGLVMGWFDTVVMVLVLVAKGASDGGNDGECGDEKVKVKLGEC